jgi:hypothetical protein
MSNVPAIRAKGFALVPLTDGPIPTVKFSGNGDTEAVSPLERFLKLLHKTLIDDQCSAVCVDLGELYFMNSSCLKAFVSWIYKVNTTVRPYQIRLQMNSRQPWQRRSLEPLKRLAPAVVQLEEPAIHVAVPAATATGGVER